MPKKRQLNLKRLGVDATAFESVRGDSRVEGRYSPSHLQTSYGEVDKQGKREGYNRAGVEIHLHNPDNPNHAQDYLFEIRSGESLRPLPPDYLFRRFTPLGSNRRSFSGQVRDIVRRADSLEDIARGNYSGIDEYHDAGREAVRSNSQNRAGISVRSGFGPAYNIFDTNPASLSISKLEKTSPGEFKGILKQLAKRFPQAKTVKLKKREFSLNKYKK